MPRNGSGARHAYHERMRTNLIGFCALFLCLRPQQNEGRLLLEGPEGARREIRTAGLSLADPRKEGAWVVWPTGFEPSPTPANSGASMRIELVGGDEIRGRVAGGEEETLFLELVGGVRLPIDIERIQAIRARMDDEQSFERPSDGDRLYRRAGAEIDRLDGTLEAFTAEGLRFSSRLGEKTYPWAEVAALFVEVLGEEPRQDAAGRTNVVIDLVDGSHLRCELRSLEEQGCSIAVSGSEMQLPWSVIGELAVDDGTLTYLSDLAPEKEEGRGTPFGDDLGMVWNHAIDHSVLGGDLRVAGKIYRRGIGTHAPTKLFYELGGSYQKLRGSVGIDDSSQTNTEAARGSVIFRVHVDGRVAWESRVVRGGDAPLEIPLIDVAGARGLVLEADPAGDFRGDRANWLRMILVR